MMRIKLLLLGLWMVWEMTSVNAQTYYYKLNSYGKTGTENTKVSGGQFITFQAAICMETDRTGVSIGTGHLRRKNNAPNTYVGSANWGSGTRFVFSPDKLTLRVYAPNGNIFRYTRTTDPSNAKTCSLLKGSSPAPVISSGGGGTPVRKPQTCGICSGSGKCSSCYGSGISTFGHAHVCGACGGTGRCGTCSGRGISGYVTEYVY